PDPVAVYSKPPEQSVSQEQVSHERRHAREDDGKNVIGLSPHVLTDGKIHGRSQDQAEEQADGDQNLRLRKHPWLFGVLTHLPQLTLHRSTCCPNRQTGARPKVLWFNHVVLFPSPINPDVIYQLCWTSAMPR